MINGERIIRRRKQMGMSAMELSAAACIGTASVTKLEQGGKSTSADIVEKVAAVLAQHSTLDTPATYADRLEWIGLDVILKKLSQPIEP